MDSLSDAMPADDDARTTRATPARKVTHMSTLADIIRTVHGNLSRNQLKVQRARLRRLGLTHLTAEKGPYALDHASHATTTRTAEPVVIVQVVSEAA